MIQTHYIYCALHFYYYAISSTSDHQALDPRGWGPLLQKRNKEELSAYRIPSRLDLQEHIQLILELLTQENVTEVH